MLSDHTVTAVPAQSTQAWVLNSGRKGNFKLAFSDVCMLALLSFLVFLQGKVLMFFYFYFFGIKCIYSNSMQKVAGPVFLTKHFCKWQGALPVTLLTNLGSTLEDDKCTSSSAFLPPPTCSGSCFIRISAMCWFMADNLLSLSGLRACVCVCVGGEGTGTFLISSALIAFLFLYLLCSNKSMLLVIVYSLGNVSGGEAVSPGCNVVCLI